MSKHVVLINKKWHPQGAPITVDVTDTDISISQPLDDYLIALAAEIGNPAFILTEASLLSNLRKAALAVNAVMKNETSKVM